MDGGSTHKNTIFALCLYGFTRFYSSSDNIYINGLRIECFERFSLAIKNIIVSFLPGKPQIFVHCYQNRHFPIASFHLRRIPFWQDTHVYISLQQFPGRSNNSQWVYNRFYQRLPTLQGSKREFDVNQHPARRGLLLPSPPNSRLES